MKISAAFARSGEFAPDNCGVSCCGYYLKVTDEILNR